VLFHPPSGLPWRSDLERLRLTQPLPPSPPLARIRNLSTIPLACTKPTRYGAHLRSESEAADGEYRIITNRRRIGRDLQGRRLSLPPLWRRPVVASQPAAGLRPRPQRREPAEESLVPLPHIRRSVECPPRLPTGLARAVSLAAGWHHATTPCPLRPFFLRPTLPRAAAVLCGPDACLWAAWAD
jgi:hypothetical protein